MKNLTYEKAITDGIFVLEIKEKITKETFEINGKIAFVRFDVYPENENSDWDLKIGNAVIFPSNIKLKKNITNMNKMATEMEIAMEAPVKKGDIFELTQKSIYIGRITMFLSRIEKPITY